MYLEINKDIFLEQLLKIQKILPQKTFFPIFNALKIQTQENKLILEANNGNIAIKIEIKDKSLKIKKQGKIACLGRYFIEIIKKINDSLIKITVMENNFLVIKTIFCEYKLKLMDVCNFLELDFSFQKLDFFQIETHFFKNIIKEVNISTSKNEKRPILMGLNLIYQNNLLKACATDFFRMSQKKINLDIKYHNFNIVIPNKSLEELSKILEHCQSKHLKIYSDAQKIFLEIDNLWFQTSLLEGNYPQIQEIKLTNFPFSIHLNKDDLMKALERVSLLFYKEQINTNVIKFILTERNSIEISSSSESLGTALEKIIPLKVSANSFQIAFNAKYLEDVLKVLSVKEVVFYFDNPLKPFIITTLEKDSSIHLILPIPLEND
ncbi:DNA polymerase III, beta subunit [Aster yellows witches'-broom phytoplasma AYWB]|uniref:Beta sliding clamp n=1 Tax=Aster yellows witches'-broom phytoplasma (strain AYWB) TaxID=322098 RepID=Q2NKC4_AYWBP|nr:DNA polymerase III subunit beta [Aster yellows witches'-broom phytoplasma]ABC65119.1 DNA polymerase III, beta subunit [Aster yellows witches'-broom phytoplasma AYWB]